MIKFLDYFQAVPILVEGSSQTELKHPKNVYTQYEPRVFTDDEVATIWESDEMKKFMIKVIFFKACPMSIQLSLEPNTYLKPMLKGCCWCSNTGEFNLIKFGTISKKIEAHHYPEYISSLYVNTKYSILLRIVIWHIFRRWSKVKNFPRLSHI